MVGIMAGNSVTATNVSLEAIINPIPDREPCKKENDKEIDAIKEATDSSPLIGAMASTQCDPELSDALICSSEGSVPVSTERQVTFCTRSLSRNNFSSEHVSFFSLVVILNFFVHPWKPCCGITV